MRLAARVAKLESVARLPRIIVVTYPDNLEMAQDEIRRQAIEQWMHEHPGHDSTNIRVVLVRLVGPPRDPSPRWSFVR